MAISRRTLIGRLSAGALAISRYGADVMAAPAERAESEARVAGGPIRLHRSENVLGPSPKATAAMQSAAQQPALRYPDVEADALRQKLADRHGVTVDEVVLGCGSTDILRMAVDAFAGPARRIVAASPTYEALTDYAQRTAAVLVNVPLRPDHSHDVEAMVSRVDAGTGLVYVCNPNNPTGTLTPRSDLEDLIRRLPTHAVALIDEAYHDYVGAAAVYESFIDRPVAGARVIVTRTFSTIHGLAGLRVGYAIASRDLARALSARQTPDCVGAIAARAASAALDDPDHVLRSVNRNADERQEFLNQANAHMLRSVDSLTNFVMLNAARPAAEVVEHFARHGILVAGSVPGYASYIRVSLGTQAEMREFWRVWGLMPGGHMHSSSP